MTRILLVVSTTRYSKRSLELALEEAAQASAPVQLELLYIRETAEMAQVTRSMDGQGFLGLEPQDEILHSLEQQHHATALRRIARVEGKAKELEGVTFSSEEVQGDYVELARERALSGDFDVVFMTRADKPFVSRLLFGNETDKVARLVRQRGGKVVVSDETPPGWME